MLWWRTAGATLRHIIQYILRRFERLMSVDRTIVWMLSQGVSTESIDKLNWEYTEACHYLSFMVGF